MSAADELRDWIANNDHHFTHKIVINNDTAECRCGAKCAALRQVQALFRTRGES